MQTSTHIVILLFCNSSADSDMWIFRELLDGLHKVGFKTNLGVDDSGFLILAMLRLGGYYLGTSLAFLNQTVSSPYVQQTLVPPNASSTERSN